MVSTTSDNRKTSRETLSVPVIVGLVVSLFGTVILGQLNLPRWIDATATRSFLANSLSTWLLVALVLAIVLSWEKRQLTSIGLRIPTRKEAAAGLVAGVAGVALGLLATAIAVITLQLEQPETLLALSQLSLPVQLAIVGTAVVTDTAGYKFVKIFATPGVANSFSLL